MKEWLKQSKVKLPLGRGTYRIVEEDIEFDFRVVIKKHTIFGGSEDGIGKSINEISAGKTIEASKPVANDC
jgi:hypothetical protein